MQVDSPARVELPRRQSDLLRTVNTMPATTRTPFRSGSKAATAGIPSPWDDEQVVKVSPIQPRPATMSCDGVDIRRLRVFVMVYRWFRAPTWGPIPIRESERASTSRDVGPLTMQRRRSEG